MSIRIPECNSKRCASGMPFENTADDAWLVSLDTRGCSLGTALPPEDILHEIVLRKLQTGRNAVQHNSYKLTMRLSEYRHSVFSSECIHIPYRLFVYTLSVCDQLCKRIMELRE